VVVRKFASNPEGGTDLPYTAPARLALLLFIEGPFDGKAMLTCKTQGKVKFYSREKGGDEIFFDGWDNKFEPGYTPSWVPSTDSPTNNGVTVFAEGLSPSGSLNDIPLEFALSGCSHTMLGPAKATITSVELTLDICKSRKTGQVDPDPLSADDKINLGRFLHVQNDQLDHGRALLIVQKVQPEAFKDCRKYPCR